MPASAQPPLILCSTHRLARSLRLSHARTQAAQGFSQWLPLQTLTVAQWLDRIFSQAQLMGQVKPGQAPRMVLGAMQERVLWERVIETELSDNPAEALFDRAGLATAAMEAHRLMTEWGVAPGHEPSHEQTQETRQFLRWRAAFGAMCRKLDVQDAASLKDAQIECLKQFPGWLPQTVYLAGFDRVSPQERRLFEVMAQRDIEVLRWPVGLEQPANAVQAAYDDVEVECRAAAAWAKVQLNANAQARIAIVVPELGALRRRLSAILDDVLHPETLHPAQAEFPRCYDFSLGTPLSAHPMIAAALALLRLSTQHYRINQQDIGVLLGNPYWSAGEREADARAILDARMRRKLGATLRWDQFMRMARSAYEGGLPVVRLMQHMEAIDAAIWPRRQAPSAWAAVFGELLKAAGWPGERSLSSHEFQARQAWTESLADFANFDPLLGAIPATEALSRLSHLCQERIFQPEAAGEPALQVMGMLESQGAPLDAIWVMGMNDHQWPPPAKPNPLLPTAAQRRAGAPNSCSQVQAQFARTLHERLLHGAPQAVFSWSRKDGERELRPSPLLAGMPSWGEPAATAATMAELLAQPAQMQHLEDHIAPPVAEGEKVGGGAGLLRAQAICPAWAYYRYRLGARMLDEPVDGLDSMDRGTLLHAVLQCFWQGRGSAELQAMDESALKRAVADAVERGVEQFGRTQDKPLPEHFLVLEKQRLRFLLTTWVEFERGRKNFVVQECERRVSLVVEGVSVDFTLDRIDALEDGRLVVIDYKTGSTVSHRSWAETRISEPQLPIYAALALANGEVAAVCFAKIRADEQKFIGIAHLPDTLPGVDGLDEARKVFDEATFPDWPSVLLHWKTSIAATAQEIRAGEAAVKFSDEADLAYCEVKPLLRLPERKLQLEREAGA